MWLHPVQHRNMHAIHLYTWVTAKYLLMNKKYFVDLTQDQAHEHELNNTSIAAMKSA